MLSQGGGMQVGFLPGKWTIIVLYTKIDVVHNMDIQCDKLATDDRRQFITLNVRLSWQHMRRSRVVAKFFVSPVFGTKFQTEVPLFLELPEWINRG